MQNGPGINNNLFGGAFEILFGTFRRATFEARPGRVSRGGPLGDLFSGAWMSLGCLRGWLLLCGDEGGMGPCWGFLFPFLYPKSVDKN